MSLTRPSAGRGVGLWNDAPAPHLDVPFPEEVALRGRPRSWTTVAWLFRLGVAIPVSGYLVWIMRLGWFAD